MDERHIASERLARRKIGIVASAFGLLFLASSFGGDWGIVGEQHHTTTTYHWLLLGSTVITGIAVITSYFGHYFVRAAIVQSVFALTTVLSALMFTFDSNIVAVGPSGAAGMLGSLLVIFGAFARVNAEVLVTWVEPVEAGRKYVYRENKVVAIEEWVGGRLVSTRPATR